MGYYLVIVRWGKLLVVLLPMILRLFLLHLIQSYRAQKKGPPSETSEHVSLRSSIWYSVCKARRQSAALTQAAKSLWHS